MINVTSKDELPKSGLYRHFKGGYYFLQNIVTDCGGETDGQKKCLYFNVEHPEYGTFTRNVEEWFDDVSEKEGNYTKQKTRFARVLSLDFQLGSVPTETLLIELSQREDSPLKNFDIEGLRSKIVVQDYVVGLLCDRPDYDKGILVTNSFHKLDSACHYIDHNKTLTGTKIYERTYVEVER